MKILSLDQALQTSGYAIFEDNKLIKWGTFSTNASLPIEKRLDTIYNQLTLLDEEYNFDYIFFEDTQKQVNLDTYKRLCYVQAIIMLWCKQCGVKEYIVLSSSHWRKLLKDKYKVAWGRKREEQKKAAQQLVEQLFDKKVTQDEADAICINVAGQIEYNKNKSAF